MNKQLQKYRESLQKRNVVETIVPVTLPESGFVIQMAKPSKYALMFRMAQTPQVASSGAVAKWAELGLVDAAEVTSEQANLTEQAIELMRRVCAFSRSPKLVTGEALNDNELSTDELTEKDAEYLMQWVALAGAGGDESSKELENFPERSNEDTLASAAKRTVGKKTKRAGGAA